MTPLTKPVRRLTVASRHEKSKTREIILSLEPPATIGVRLKGTRATYRLPAEAVYELAVINHARDIDREARRIAKEEGIRVSAARPKAERKLRSRLESL